MSADVDGVDAYGFDPEDLVDEGFGDLTSEPASPEPETEKRGLVYESLDRFVSELLANTYRRAVDGRTLTWCPEWWRHPEAIVRLEALWRAWEHLRLDPATGTSVWLRDHLDHHMPVLTDIDGPFKGCSPDKGHGARLQPLPVIDPPKGMFG